MLGIQCFIVRVLIIFYVNTQIVGYPSAAVHQRGYLPLTLPVRYITLCLPVLIVNYENSNLNFNQLTQSCDENNLQNHTHILSHILFARETDNEDIEPPVLGTIVFAIDDKSTNVNEEFLEVPKIYSSICRLSRERLVGEESNFRYFVFFISYLRSNEWRCRTRLMLTWNNIYLL